MIKGKTVVLGVTGSIAAYKAAEIARELVKREIQVRVAMTEAATHFIAPLTFEALTQNKVFTAIFDQEAAKIPYLVLSHGADLILVAPATATIIAKAAAGFADDILSATILSATCPVIFAPAMHSEMYVNPATQENILTLKKRGNIFIEPEEGELADRTRGIGRLAEINKIVQAVTSELEREEDLRGKKVIVTAGGTRESLDPARFLGNRSSGKMGYALADEARRRGAKTVLISTPVSVLPPPNVELIAVKTALEMREAVLKRAPKADLVIMSAAVSDFRPVTYEEQKIKKQKKLILELEENPDILEELGNLKRVKSPTFAKASAGRQESRVKKPKNQKTITNYHFPVLVGFAAESENLLKNAREKLNDKNLDLVVATDITKEGSGFGQDFLQFAIVNREEKVENFPLISKIEAARIILNKAVAHLKNR